MSPNHAVDYDEEDKLDSAENPPKDEGTASQDEKESEKDDKEAEESREETDGGDKSDSEENKENTDDESSPISPKKPEKPSSASHEDAGDSDNSDDEPLVITLNFKLIPQPLLKPNSLYSNPVFSPMQSKWKLKKGKSSSRR